MTLASFDILVLALGALGLGIVMLMRGGNWTIDAAIHLAQAWGVSPLVIGFTIVALGTSLPELIVSVNANFNGAPGIAVGNVLGSNIANILLVVGATALVTTLVAVPKKLLRDLVAMLLATALLAGLLLTQEIGRLAGGVMVLMLLGFVFWQYWVAAKGENLEDIIEELEDPAFSHLLSALSFLLLGLVFIALGAEFLVRGAKVSASIIGVPDAVIALSVVALGTSLPELSTCLIAAARKQTDLILGNIIGSNVFNIMLIIGVTTLARPIVTADLAPQLINMDIWVMAAISLVFTLLLLFYGKIGRFLGILFLTGYAAYIIAMYALYLVV